MNAESGSVDTRAQVVALARELGFDLCRFAPAETPRHAAEFRDWLDRGDAIYRRTQLGGTVQLAGETHSLIEIAVPGLKDRPEDVLAEKYL